MPLFEQNILQVWELYNEAEDLIAEVSSLQDGLDTPAVNQLRYPRRHLLNSLTGKTSIAPEQEYERAVAHVKRAICEALDSGIIYCLQEIQLFRNDYRKIEITIPGHLNIISLARKAKHLLDKAHKDFDNCHEYYQEARKQFKLLKEACEVLEDTRSEQNKRLSSYNRKIFITYVVLFGTILSAIFTALTFFSSP